MFAFLKRKKNAVPQSKTLFGAALNTEHQIKHLSTDQAEVSHFLNTLGCYEGEKITIVSVLSDTYVVALKDARYSIDADLAKTIVLH